MNAGRKKSSKKNSKASNERARPPKTRRRFSDDRDEAQYLHDKLVYWLYATNTSPVRVRMFANRLRRLISKHPCFMNTIRGNQDGALICEALLDWAGVVRHKRKEIRLWYELRATSQPGDSIARGKVASAADLSLAYNELAHGLWKRGRRSEALATLERAKALCKTEGTEYDDLGLEEMIREL
ncbi:MAG: hypothetical protein AB7P03_00005 [Kofleriaceae bacterium]